MGAQPQPQAPEDTELRGIAKTLRKLGALAKTSTLAQVDVVDKRAGQELRAAVRRAPAFLVRLVHLSVDEVADELKDKGEVDPEDLQGIARAVARVTHDPRNAREAAKALECVQDIISSEPAVKRLTSKVIQRLEDNGVLGLGDLAQLVRWLGVAAQTGELAKRVLEGGNLAIATGPLSLSVNRLGEYSAHLKFPNPAWPRQAVRFSVSGSPGRPVKHVGVRLPLVVRVKTGRPGRVTVTPYLKAEIDEGVWSRQGTGPVEEWEGGLQATFRFGGDGPDEAPGPAPSGPLLQATHDGLPADTFIPRGTMFREGLLQFDLNRERSLGVSPYVKPAFDEDTRRAGVEEVGLKAKVRFGDHDRHPVRSKNEVPVVLGLLVFGAVLAAEWNG